MSNRITIKEVDQLFGIFTLLYMDMMIINFDNKFTLKKYKIGNIEKMRLIILF